LSPQRAALVEGWPVLLSVVVVGIPFGIVARQSGLSPAEIVAMSVFVFAGASQFAMVQLFKDGVGWPLVVLLAAWRIRRSARSGARRSCPSAHTSSSGPAP